MRIIGSDYDGTLSHGGFGEEKIIAMRKWREKGNRIGVVTGRNLSIIPHIPKECFELLDFLIVFNGGIIATPDEEILYDVTCTDIPVKELAKDLLDRGYDVVHIHGDKYYRVWAEKSPGEDCDYLLSELPEIPFIHQITAGGISVEHATETANFIREKYGDKLDPLQNWTYLDIVPLGVNKANGLRKYAELVGVSEDNVIAVGDSLNDASMLAAFRSYAIAEGSPEIQDIATFRISTVTELINRELEEAE